MEVSRSGNILLCFKGDSKNIFEYRSGKEVKVHPVEGQKKVRYLRCRLSSNSKTTTSSWSPLRNATKRMKKAMINTLCKSWIHLTNTSPSLKPTAKWKLCSPMIKISHLWSAIRKVSVSFFHSLKKTTPSRLRPFSRGPSITRPGDSPKTRTARSRYLLRYPDCTEICFTLKVIFLVRSGNTLSLSVSYSHLM